MKKKIVEQKEKTQKSEVIAELSKIPISRSKNSFKIKYEGSVLGTLKFSVGSIQWCAKNKSTPTCSLSWTKFAELMEKQK